MVFSYIFIIIVIILIIFIVYKSYLRIKHPFWSIQPVFHVYDIKKWFNSNQMIDKNIAIINNYIDLINIKTYKLSLCNTELLHRCVNFIKKYYLHSKNTHYKPSYEYFIKSFYDLTNSYITIYKTPSYLEGIISPQPPIEKGIISPLRDIIEDYEIKGMITSKPMQLILDNKIYNCYYVDNLCVHSQYRKQNIAPKLIQTHYYHLCQYIRKPTICLFKRENELTQIVPLTTYSIISYSIKDIMRISEFINSNSNSLSINYSNTNNYKNIKSILLLSKLRCIHIYKNNISLFIDFIKQVKKEKIFKCFILSKIKDVIYYIQNNYFIVYGLYDEKTQQLISVYIFKNSNTIYKKEKMLECIASINYEKEKKEKKYFNFINGFLYALQNIHKVYNYNKLLLENISHNIYLLENIDKYIDKYNDKYNDKYKKYDISPIFKTCAGFYLYNFTSFTIKANNCFILY